MTDSSWLVQLWTQVMISEPLVLMWTQEGSVSVSSVGQWLGARLACQEVRG